MTARSRHEYRQQIKSGRAGEKNMVKVTKNPDGSITVGKADSDEREYACRKKDGSIVVVNDGAILIDYISDVVYGGIVSDEDSVNRSIAAIALAQVLDQVLKEIEGIFVEGGIEYDEEAEKKRETTASREALTALAHYRLKSMQCSRTVQ
jgi:hypothetical protein